MSDKPTRGSCFCGQITYEFGGNLGIFQYCHCSRCRKVTGSAHASNILVDPNDFSYTSGEELLGRYEPSDSKHFATSFCKNCGSLMPWITKTKKAVIVPAGTLDSEPEIQPQHNIYWASKAGWYLDPDKLKKWDALPIKK